MHIGNILRERLKNDGKSVVWLARELGCHRTNIYRIYEKHTVDTGILLRLCRILHYDFFQLYSEELTKEAR